MALASHILCLVLSAACAWLLLRQYRQVRLGLLLWSGLCFAGLSISNLLVVVDLTWLVEIDLFGLRNAVTLISVAVLLYGVIWETR